MKKIFIYECYFDPLDLYLKKEGKVYKILKEKEDSYFLENVKNFMDQILIYKEQEILNGKIEEEYYEEYGEPNSRKYTAGFVFNDKEKNIKEKKKQLMLEIDKKIKKEIDEVNEKIKKLNKTYKSTFKEI